MMTEERRTPPPRRIKRVDPQSQTKTLGYSIQVERRWQIGAWLEITREVGPPAETRFCAVNMLHRYYAKHWPDRNLRVVSLPGGHLIAIAGPHAEGLKK